MSVDVVEDTSTETREIRHYFCKMCPEKAQGYTMPKGWFIVRRTHEDGEIPRTIGLYSKSECLAVDILSRELGISPQHARLLMVSHHSR